MEKISVREDLAKKFDPNGQGVPGHLFGLPFTPPDSAIVILPIPWEATVSYHTGAADGPAAVLEASGQVDLFVKDIPDAWKAGISMLPVPQDIAVESGRIRELAAQHIQRLERNGKVSSTDPLLMKINEACENLNIYVKSAIRKLLRDGKMVGLLGGDHSTPLGFIRALGEEFEQFGILQIDAHADLRKAYQGFAYSHASIMYNALKIPAVTKLIQVGIRDFCDEEMAVIDRAPGRIVTFFDDDIKSEMYKGRTWDDICDKIISSLPADVYISFDIDGLDPKLCPNTGTPVAGGFEFFQVTYLLRRIVKSGRKIIGFDLNEIGVSENSDWDANVGARMLYQLCNLMAVSQGKLKLIA
jgi:agmatinase